MPKTKFGVGDNVSTDTGFSPYEGPLPKPGTVYPVEQKSAVLRLTGENAKTPGVEYIRSMWEITSGECKGFTTWHNVVPGDSEIQQSRVAQYMQAVCGKNSAPLVHDDIDDGGKITKVGTRNPVGIVAGMTFQRKKDSYGVPEGEEAVWKAESNDIIPGWKPKGKTAVVEDDDVEDEYEDEEEVEVEEEAPTAKPASRRRAPAKAAPAPEPDPEPEDEDEEVEEDEDDDAEEEGDDDQVSYDKASKLTLVELKKLAKEYEYEDSELNPFKGPAGKKKLLAKLVEDEIVAAEETEDEPPF
jgi:hypothetical protein